MLLYLYLIYSLDMKKLQVVSNYNSEFCPGSSTDTDIAQGISLLDLSANYQILLDTGQPLGGHTKFCHVCAA
jgi:hypothetical protein